MQTTFLVERNSVPSHADVVITTTAPSGSIFTATDAAEETEFLFNTPSFESYELSVAPLVWRILLQVVAMQLNEYNKAINGEHETWKTRILETLQRINLKAQLFKPQSFPCNITPPTAEYLALSAMGVNWCDTMTASLSAIFSSVPCVSTLKIELPFENVPILSEVGTLFNQQDNRINAAD